VLKKFIGDKGGCTITKPTFQENTQYNLRVSKPKKLTEIVREERINSRKKSLKKLLF
jgi:hypothetical protein